MPDNPFSTIKNLITGNSGHTSAAGFSHGGGESFGGGGHSRGYDPSAIVSTPTPTPTSTYTPSQSDYSKYGYNPNYTAATTSTSAKSAASGGTSKSGSNVSNNSVNLGAYLAQLNAERQAAAEEAYNRASGMLNDAYNKARGNYENIYNNGVDQLGRSYNNSLGKINDNANQSMQEAYINKMLSMKNLSQALAAQGLSGGASESATAGLINNYGNARNGIQKTWDTNRNDLEMNYNANLSDLYSAFQSQMANLDNQLAAQQANLINNLNNQIASAGGDYYSALMANPELLQSAMSGAVQKLGAYTPQNAEVTNTVNSVNTQQSNDMGQATQYAKWLTSLQQNAQVNPGFAQNLINAGLDNKSIADLINQQYFAR